MNYKTKDKRILFDLNHPADYHFFKNLILQLHKEGYLIYVIARDKDCLQSLLKNAGIRFVSRGQGSHYKIGKYIYGIYNLLLTLIIILKSRPGISLSLSSPYLAVASKISGIPCITYDDTDDNPRLEPMLRQSTYVFSPQNYPKKFHRNHFHLNALKELAYLHPKYFKNKVRGDDIFIRLTRTDSIHHSSSSDMDIDVLVKQVNNFAGQFTTWLSSEIDLRNWNVSDKINYPDVVNIHNYLFKSRVFWGNSATMAAEAAVLGIPSVFVSGEKFSYIKELEDSGLLFHYAPDQLDDSFEKLHELANNDARRDYEHLSRTLVKEKIDITEFLMWFIKNLPESAEAIKSNPDYQLNFLS